MVEMLSTLKPMKAMKAMKAAVMKKPAVQKKPSAVVEECNVLKVHFQWGKKPLELIMFHFDGNPTMEEFHDGVCAASDQVHLNEVELNVSRECASFFNSKQEPLDRTKTVKDLNLKNKDVVGVLVEEHIIHGHMVFDVPDTMAEAVPEVKIVTEAKHGMPQPSGTF